MSREDYSTHCDMASRANKGVVLKATDSHRVLRDHVRKDQLSVTRCTVHRSHSLAERPPIVGSIEHSQRHPEVTRYGDELFVMLGIADTEVRLMIRERPEGSFRRVAHARQRL